MKIKVYGKAHIEGVSKKTGNPYNLTVLHYLGKARGVEGQAAMTLMLDAFSFPLSSIVVGSEYNVEFDQRGYPVEFSLASRG